MQLFFKGNWLIDTTAKKAYKPVNGPWFLVADKKGVIGGLHWVALPDFIKTRFLDMATDTTKKAA